MGLADFAVTKSKDKESFPGPGQYNPKLPTGRAAAMRGRVETRAGLLTGTTGDIGPGKYEVPSTIGTAAGGKWTSMNRTAARGTETELGPKYDVRNFDMASNPATPRMRFGSKPTPRTPRDDAVPAPPAPSAQDADPSLTPRHKRQGFSFGIRPQVREPKEGKDPGPGAYDVPRFGDQPSKTPRPPPAPHVDRDHMSPRETAPGPGAYDVRNRTIGDEVRPKHRGHVSHGTMGGRNFPPEPASNDLGPGQYDDPQTIGARAASSKKPGVTILGRFSEFTDMDDIYPRPAPGDYNVPSSFDTKGKGCTFGSRHAPPKADADVPGPGYVEPEQYSMAKMATKSPRGVHFNANGRTFTEGVKRTSPLKADAEKDGATPRGSKKDSSKGATASLPSLPVASRGPGFTLSGRHKQAEPDMTGPGPGSYDAYKYEQRAGGTTFYRGPYGTR